MPPKKKPSLADTLIVRNLLDELAEHNLGLTNLPVSAVSSILEGKVTGLNLTGINKINFDFQQRPLLFSQLSQLRQITWEGSNRFVLPDAATPFPNFIHFEFYDATPDDTLDAGVYIQQAIMYVNGRAVKARIGQQKFFARSYFGDHDGILLPRELPLVRPLSGKIPLIVEFAIASEYWEYSEGAAFSGTIDSISFEFFAAGNIEAFMTTDQCVSTIEDSTINPVTGQYEYIDIISNVGSIFDEGLKTYLGFTEPAPLAYNWPEFYYPTFFGEYFSMTRSTGTDAGLKDAIALYEQNGDNAPLQAYDYRRIRHSFAYPLRFEFSRYFKSDFTSPRLRT